jgi:hypothetical protein
VHCRARVAVPLSQGLKPLEEFAMSHKHKAHREVVSTSHGSDPAVESRPIEKMPIEPFRALPPAPDHEAQGLTWQPIFVFVAIGLGFVVILAKVLKLF